VISHYTLLQSHRSSRHSSRISQSSCFGDTATYRDVLPGVDLEVTASDQGGLKEVLVIRNAAAAADPALRRLRLAIATRGLIGPAAGRSYFTGEISDVEYYTYPVAPSDVAALQSGQGPLGSGPE
jgi:hypothetical protein